MLELAFVVIALIIAIMVKSRVASSMDWTGQQITQLAKPIESGISSLAYVSAAGELKSNDMLEEVAFDIYENTHERSQKQAKLETKMTDPEKEIMKTKQEMIDKILAKARS